MDCPRPACKYHWNPKPPKNAPADWKPKKCPKCNQWIK